jgi:hypothetical protein
MRVGGPVQPCLNLLVLSGYFNSRFQYLFYKGVFIGREIFSIISAWLDDAKGFLNKRFTKKINIIKTNPSKIVRNQRYVNIAPLVLLVPGIRAIQPVIETQ